jgi:hypothetical protein
MLIFKQPRARVFADGCRERRGPGDANVAIAQPKSEAGVMEDGELRLRWLCAWVLRAAHGRTLRLVVLLLELEAEALLPRA